MNSALVDNSSSLHPELAQARLLLQSGEHEAARLLLKGLIARDPACTEAINLLLAVDAQQRRGRSSSGTGSRSSWLGAKAGAELGALLLGALLVWVAVTNGRETIPQLRQVGMNSQVAVYNSKTGTTSQVSARGQLLFVGASGLCGVLLVGYGLARLRFK